MEYSAVFGLGSMLAGLLLLSFLKSGIEERNASGEKESAVDEDSSSALLFW